MRSHYYLQEKAARYWINNGLDTNKLVIGLPTYGRGFTVYPKRNPNGQISWEYSGASRSGRFTQESGFLAYYEVRVCCVYLVRTNYH